MAKRTFDVLIVGAGPAGLAAACRAARIGPVDGHHRRQPRARRPNLAKRERFPSGAGLPAALPIFTGARVIAAPAPATAWPSRRLTEDFEFAYRTLILATGARERFLPFPGWTLPHVIGAGGLQALAKSGLPIAGKRIVIAGSGPLLLAVAKYLKDHGANVRVIAEQADQSSLVRFRPGSPRIPASSCRPRNSAPACWAFRISPVAGRWPPRPGERDPAPRPRKPGRSPATIWPAASA